jgi:hypothetical protein
MQSSQWVIVTYLYSFEPSEVGRQSLQRMCLANQPRVFNLVNQEVLQLF